MEKAIPNSPTDVIAITLNPMLLRLPVYSGKVAAGQSRWASAAQDYDDDDEGTLGGRLDLNTHFVQSNAVLIYGT